LRLLLPWSVAVAVSAGKSLCNKPRAHVSYSGDYFALRLTMSARHRIRFAAAAAVALAGVACSKSGQPMDDGLKQDLAAVKTSASHVSISPVELGERSTPAPQQHAPRPVKLQAAAVAPKHVVAQVPQVEKAPDPVLVVQAPLPAPQPVEQPAPAAAKPTPVPMRSNGEEQHGRYKSEAEVFRQMPWIKP
jgi:hypothetical protein